MRKHFVETKSATICVMETDNSGPAVLMLHGNSGSKEIFEAQFSGLGDICRLVAIDLAGHGESSNAIDPSVDYTLGGHAAYVAEVVRKLGIDEVVVVGTSLGGHIALELTRLLSGGKGVMIVGTPPFAKSIESLGEAFLPGPALELSGKDILSPDDIEAFLGLHELGAHFDDATFRWAMGRADGAVRTTLVSSLLLEEALDQRALAENCAWPIAVVNGAGDECVNLEYFKSLRLKSLWSGRTHGIVGAGHAPHVSHADEFNHLLRAFVFGALGLRQGFRNP